MKHRTRPYIALIVLAFLLAMAVAWKTAPRSEKAAQVDQRIVTQTVAERIPERRDSAARVVARRMKSIRDGATQEERIRSSVSLAMSLPVSEFAAWAQGDRFDFRAGPELNIFRMVLFERWIVEDPEGLIGFCADHDHGQASRAVTRLLEEDPERVLEYFRKNPNDRFELEKLAILAGRNTALALSRLREISGRGLDGRLADQSGRLFWILAKESTGMLEAAMEDLDPKLRKRAEIALSSRRLKDDFGKEIRVLWERPDGWKLFCDAISSSGSAEAKLLDEIENLPDSWKVSLGRSPEYAVRGDNARQWLEADLEAAGFSKSDAAHIRKEAAAHYAMTDPAYVIGALDTMDFDRREKAELFSNVFRKLKNSPGEAEKLIAGLTSEEDRAGATEQLELVRSAVGSNKPLAPAEVLKAYATPGQMESPYLIRVHTGTWGEDEVREFTMGFGRLEKDERLRVAMLVASRSDGNASITGDAVRYLVNNTPENKPAESGSPREDLRFIAAQHAVRLASVDFNTASEWISILPAGDAKKWAQRNVAEELRQYDPAAVREWMKTLPTAERADVEGYLK